MKGWPIRAAVFIGLGLACASPAVVAANPRLHLIVTLDPRPVGSGEPLVASGASGAADFIYVKILGGGLAAIGYDAWGYPEVVSKPFALPAGVPCRIDLEAPSVARGLEGESSPEPRLRAWANGIQVANAPVHFHRLDTTLLFFGQNPLGGSSCASALHGRLVSADGAPLRSASQWRMRWNDARADLARGFAWLIRHRRALVVLLAAVLTVLAIEPVFGRRLGQPAGGALGWIVGAAGMAVFLFFVTGQSFQLFYPDDFGGFYDAQAHALLHGRLDVPPRAIGAEAFVFRGRTFGYFGPTPALIRLAIGGGLALAGQWTRVLMAVDFAVCLVASQLLLRDAVRCRRGPGGRPSRRSVLLLLLNVGLGSSLLFLGSRAYVYHEAILCGVAWALISAVAAFRYVERPTTARWLTGFAAGVLAVQARPPAGLFALAVLAIAGLIVHRSRSWRRGVLLAAGCLLGFATFSGMSYLKFRTFDGSPFQYQVQYTPERRAKFGGRNFHLSNLPFNACGYLYGGDVVFRSSFPFVYAGGPDVSGFPEAAVDITEAVVPLPYCMTGLCLLTVIGAAAAVRERAARAKTIVLWLGVAPMAAALLAAIVMSQRYTADFCPFLVTGAAFGLAAIDGRRLSIAWRSGLWLATAWAIGMSLALAWDFQGERVWGSPPGVRARFASVRESVDRWVQAKP